MTDILTTLKTFVVTAWDEFQTGVKWLETEASHIGAWLQKVDPEIAAAFQDVIKTGEASAEALVQYEGQALGPLIAAAIPDAESLAASLITNALGGNPAAVIASKGAAQVIADIGEVLGHVNNVAVVKVVSGIAQAANAATAPASAG